MVGACLRACLKSGVTGLSMLGLLLTAGCSGPTAVPTEIAGQRADKALGARVETAEQAHPAEVLERFDLLQAPVAAQRAAADVVAEVRVVEAGEARFNTPDGGLPTPGAEDDALGYVIFRPLRLQVEQVWKMPAALDGMDFVISRSGGELAGLRYQIEPPEDLSPGDRGIVFLGLPDPSWAEDPPPWFDVLEASADAWVAAGEADAATAMLLNNWYRFEARGDGLLAISEIEGRQLSRSELVAEIEAAP